MSKFYTIKKGNVHRESVENKKIKYRLTLKKVCYGIVILLSFIITFLVFKKCINDKDGLAECISLGAIFATFGSAIVSGASIYMNNKFERFKNDYDILFTELASEDKWQRWVFIKRKRLRKIYNNKQTYQELKNAEVEFDVGSHRIIVQIPTILEDFDDLPNWKSFFTMTTNDKDYESTVVKDDDNQDNNENYNSLLVWDCVYDMLKNIIKYKVARLIIVFGICLIVTSILFSFSYLELKGVFTCL